MNNELEKVLQGTLGNSHLSRDQKKTLNQLLKEIGGDKRALSTFRDQAFNLAREQLPSEHHLVLNWLETLIKPAMGATRLPEPENQDEVWFSPGTTCLQQIRKALDEAEHTIDICVFTITDDRVAERILAASRRGIKLRIISDNDKRFDMGSDIERFHKQGIAVRIDASHKHMHHKFAVFDQRYVLTGSYNWTRSAATHNEENLVKLHDTKLVTAFQKEFNHLWPEMRPCP